jgi:glycopeptide antibiotics resistance protein
MTGAGPHERAWPWFLGAGAVYLGTLVGTWWPRVGPTGVNLIPFRPHLQALRRGAWTPEARRAGCDLAINVVLLMPAAFLLAQGFRRTRGARGCVGPTVALGCLGSVVIEGGQVCIPGRVPDATDVVLNSLGVGISSALVGLRDGAALDILRCQTATH